MIETVRCIDAPTNSLCDTSDISGAEFLSGFTSSTFAPIGVRTSFDSAISKRFWMALAQPKISLQFFDLGLVSRGEYYIIGINLDQHEIFILSKFMNTWVRVGEEAEFP